MANTFTVSRSQLIFAVCMPLAVLVGYFLAEPSDLGSLAVVVLVLGMLAVPILMRWYHPLLIVAWNAAISPFFLPGRPYLWMLLAGAGLIFAVLNRISNPEVRFVIVPPITHALIGLGIVVLGTALLRGGLNIRSLGGSSGGGKGYFCIGAAIAGYFALTSRRLPVNRAGLYVGLFFLSGFTGLVPNLAYWIGPRADFLYYLFPPEFALEQAMSEYGVNADYTRIYGLTPACIALYGWLLARYGLRGLFDWNKPWLLLLLGLAAAGCLLCGFRSTVLILGLTTAAQMYFEGLCRPRLLLGLASGLLLAALLVLPNAAKLPHVVQRTLSFLPIDIAPGVRQQAEYSAQWRLGMWQELLPMVPQYLFKGKGYIYEPGELELAAENVARGYSKDYAFSLAAGDYHNGPLSVIIPLGIWGMFAFVWFLAAVLKYLYDNFRRGDPALHVINTFLLVYFVARVVFFLLFFGSFFWDLYIFTGLAGLSVSLNGVRQPAADAEPASEFEEETGFHEDLVPE